MTPSDILKAMVTAIEGRDAEAFAALFAEDAVGYHPMFPGGVRGRAAIKEAEQSLFAAFDDVQVRVRGVLAEERRCAAEVVLTAVNTGPLDLGGDAPMPATGRTIEMPAVWWLELGPDGLIAETRDYFDTATMMTQLGVQQP
ncbi:MAG TPA: nuclear transport factor 2 family protein [Egibacteraceae bacterium]|jgi:steroid delta-isomerase-like uncharacterized protein|nr:nuclear transport factor 2 family protein [Egibacteraceae bacterium]